MLSLVVLYFALIIYSGETFLFRCDFETPCVNFTIDSNWALTDGLHPRPINHDHTLNTSLGHYLFYQPQNRTQLLLAQIKTADWVQPTTDRAVCFSMWYYTRRVTFPFSIQLVQGDDEQLTRIVATVPGKDPSTNDWAQVTVTLPAEQVKIFIRLNETTGLLAFDDLTVDFCDRPRPLPPKVLLSCDFESSCNDTLYSLPYYPYQWSTIQASDAAKQEDQAPSIDYTFRNGSGHYIWLDNYEHTEKGYVGYLGTRAAFNVTANETYCLSFEYYGYGQEPTARLTVYLWDTRNAVQLIWPPEDPNQFGYTINTWTWGIINLPVGIYSLLFRVDSTYYRHHSFAVDNIAITSCAYPPSKLPPYGSLLSFACNFDNLTMCDMENGHYTYPFSFNFTRVAGDTVPNRKLGPTRDHTSNSTSGGFLYWNQKLPFVAWDNGTVHPSKPIEENVGLCIRFAYYVKSLGSHSNGTILSLNIDGYYPIGLWDQTLNDSHGWQVVTVPATNFPFPFTFYFSVQQTETIPVSVAFDDIEIRQCSSFNSTTNSS